MQTHGRSPDLSLVGIGLYTPAEAGRLIGVSPSTLGRWLRGYAIREQAYPPLWTSQVRLDDDAAYLGFLDLLQARMSAALIGQGLSPQKVRRAISTATDIIRMSHPFASARFRTDGRTILLETLVAGEDDSLIDLFSGGQYVMRSVIEPSLKDVEFDTDLASRWWPHGRQGGVVLDPARQFGRPIDDESGVPTSILSSAAVAEGSARAAARAFGVSTAAVRRAVAFEHRLAA